MIILPHLPGVYDHHIVHCSATPASMDIGASWLDRVHRQRGWSGCGYHIVITRSGEIQWSGSGHRTRVIGQPGAHVGGCGPGWNRRCLGTTLIGGVKEDGRTPEQNFTAEQYAALWSVIESAEAAFGIPIANVIGHRDLIKMTNAAPKACPCFSVREFVTEHEDLERYDPERLSYGWDRKSMPAPQRGEKLVLRKQYIVKDGDTLWAISRTSGVPLKEIRRLNDLPGDVIRTGQRLRLLD